MTPFQLSAVALVERGVRSIDLAGDRRTPTGSVADLSLLAGMARRG